MAKKIVSRKTEKQNEKIKDLAEAGLKELEEKYFKKLDKDLKKLSKRNFTEFKKGVLDYIRNIHEACSKLSDEICSQVKLCSEQHDNIIGGVKDALKERDDLIPPSHFATPEDLKFTCIFHESLVG